MDIEDKTAIAELTGDLRWQIDQMGPRGIKNGAGNPYVPSYYKRGLRTAIDRGGLAVADYVRSYVSKPPSGGYRKLEEANSLDLACEALVADPAKPYARLFTDDERNAAHARLAPHLEAIQTRNTAREQRISKRRADLPVGIDDLRALAAQSPEPEEAVAINTAILDQSSGDVVALNRVGRAYETIGLTDQAKAAFGQVLQHDPTNKIAAGRLNELIRLRP
jgi:tetratricopeptide (TPR) repeat protein